MTIQVSDSLGGASPAACVELLRLRPLLFATAWKVVDVFVETLMRMDGRVPDQQGGYYIKTKVKALKQGLPQPLLAQDLWLALAEIYENTTELRHSLVHRFVHADPSGALVGHTAAKAPLPPMSAGDQEALVRVACRLGEAASGGSPADERTHRDLTAWLAELAQWHGQTLNSLGAVGGILEVTVVVARDDAMGGYRLDVPALLASPNLVDHHYMDLVVEYADQPGRTARGRLETAPEEVIVLDADSLPTWLS